GVHLAELLLILDSSYHRGDGQGTFELTVVVAGNLLEHVASRRPDVTQQLHLELKPGVGIGQVIRTAIKIRREGLKAAIIRQKLGAVSRIAIPGVDSRFSLIE